MIAGDELGDHGQRDAADRDHPVGRPVSLAARRSRRRGWRAGRRSRRRQAASLSEWHERVCRRGRSRARRSASDSPRSPWKKLEIQSPYCVSSGRSVPSSSLSASTAAWSANGPRMRRPTLPGRIWVPKKTIRLSRNSVIDGEAEPLEEEPSHPAPASLFGGRPELARSPGRRDEPGQAVKLACERSNWPVAAEIAPCRFGLAAERKL